MCLNSVRAAENSSSAALMCQSMEPPTSKNSKTFTALCRSGRIRMSRDWPPDKATDGVLAQVFFGDTRGHSFGPPIPRPQK